MVVVDFGKQHEVIIEVVDEVFLVVNTVKVVEKLVVS